MGNYRIFIKKTFYICGTFGFLAYFAYFIKLLIWPEGAFPLFIAVLGCIIAGVPLIIYNKLKSFISQKFFFALENIYAYIMLFYTVTFILLSSFVFSARFTEINESDIPDNTVFIVYGAGLEGKNPGSVLKKRLDKTVELMNELDKSICVVSGCQGKNEIVSEAAAMRDYLIEQGINENRILLEDKSKDTVQNIKYSFAMIDRCGYSDYYAVSVSNCFHVPRIKYLCSRLSYKSDYVLAKDPSLTSLFSIMVREYMSYAKMLLKGTL